MLSFLRCRAGVRAFAALCALVASVPTLQAAAAPPKSPVSAALRATLVRYLKERRSAEHISAASVSVSLPSGRTIDTAAGTTAFGGGALVTPASLFQIGSTTKAFTTVLTLKLQADGKLSIDDTLGKWLPQYPAWKNVTIRHILDMTSGIPSYDDTQRWQRAFAANPKQFFSSAKLVSYVVGMPMLHGWNYSNTGYVLTGMIDEKASGGTAYTDLLRSRVLAPSGISDVYYYPDMYPQALRDRTVEGYFDSNNKDNAGLAPIYGKSVRDDSVSWAQAAGGIVATPHAVAQWARQLYQGSIITAADRAQVEKYVSTATGKPIAEVSARDPRGFGLGIARAYMPGLGVFMFYEGETLGYRMVHAYFPKQNVVLAVGLNSQPRQGSDEVGTLMQGLVKVLARNGLF
jgi:D-alanyl-D-alanine carboxypeptidase